MKDRNILALYTQTMITSRGPLPPPFPSPPNALNPILTLFRYNPPPPLPLQPSPSPPTLITLLNPFHQEVYVDFFLLFTILPRPMSSPLTFPPPTLLTLLKPISYSCPIPESKILFVIPKIMKYPGSSRGYLKNKQTWT